MTQDELIDRLSLMLAGFPATANDAEQTARAYLYAIKDVPTEFVGEACTRFLSGQVSGRRNQSFAPSSEELAKEARRLWGIEIDRERQARREREQIEERPGELSPEEAARRKEAVDRILTEAGYGMLTDEAKQESRERAERDLGEMRLHKRTEPYEISDALKALLKRQADEAHTPEQER